MFLPNNSLLVTTEGIKSVQNLNNEKIFTFSDNLTELNKKESKEKITYIDSAIFPTFAIGNDLHLLIGKIYKNQEILNMKNNYFLLKDVKKGDYLIVPKLNYQTSRTITKTECWLYAKFLTSGIFSKDKDGIDIIIIKPKKFSKSEALSLNNIEDLTYNLNKKIIYIKNKNIVERFKTNKKTLDKSLYNAPNNFCKYFMHSLLIENNEQQIEIQNKALTFELFTFFYSKLNIVFKVIEIKHDNSNAKTYILKKANNKEFLILNNHLYVEIKLIYDGKTVPGINFNNKKNHKIHGGFCLFF